jgi:hypothetical protein
MAKIDRYNGNLKAFASDATGTERTIFGDNAQSDELDANITADLLRGWGVVGPTSNPTKQDFNGLGFTLGQLIAYLHQQGIPEWNTSQEYYRGSVVTTLAGIYRLKNGGDATVDPDNDNGTNWELAPTRAQVDAKADQATTYTETEVDGLLNTKADQATTYTETEVDGLLNTKADQATTYTETEVDELTGSLAYPNTTLASSSDISETLASPIAAYPHIQGFRTGTGTARTFAQVVEEAAERGARLLTIQELEAGVSYNTGSAYNKEITWTSSPAGVGLVYGNLGDGEGTRVVLNTNTDTAAGGYAVSVVGQRQWTDTQYADKATTYTETEVDDLIATRTESPSETTVTGTATFTNATNNIALTGLGSIGLEIGDVVQVTGTASNNKLFTVEVITDSGNVIVNQAHRGGTTTKSLVDETVSATVTLVAKWFNAPIGLGQGWVNQTSSLSRGVTYTGIQGRGMETIISYDRVGALTIDIDGDTYIFTVDFTGGVQLSTSFITHSTSTYEVNTETIPNRLDFSQLR